MAKYEGLFVNLIDRVFPSRLTVTCPVTFSKPAYLTEIHRHATNIDAFTAQLIGSQPVSVVTNRGYRAKPVYHGVTRVGYTRGGN